VAVCVFDRIKLMDRTGEMSTYRIRSFSLLPPEI
jgi:hypothetical protein